MRSSISGSGTPTGEGVLKDDAEAVRWYRLAADQGDADAQFDPRGQVRQRARASSRTMPKRCAGTGWPPTRVTPMRPVQSRGHVRQRARAYLKDDAEAVRWYRLAADQGAAAAQFNLGVMYGNGEGVLKDDAEAVRWYRLAADQGDAGAQFILGFKYANGEGVLKDSVLAHMWCNIAGANGHASRPGVAGQS